MISLKNLIKEKKSSLQEEEAVDIKGATLPLQALTKIGVLKPEYLNVVLGKVAKGQKLPPVDDKYLADVFLKILATTDVNAMNQLFNAIRAVSAKKDNK